jgi:hypothetical protein
MRSLSAANGTDTSGPKWLLGAATCAALATLIASELDAATSWR